jgi:hypothetical protein
VEEHLPIADRLWTTILAKPNLSLALLARAGLFYWICRDPAQAPPRALVALGRVCEGDCFEFWRVPPFLPIWAASRRAADDGDWTLAALCWKRALVDIVIFDRALGPEGLEQVHAFPFDPRFVKDIHLHIRNAEPAAEPMFHLALELAVDSLRGSDLGGWSQLNFVLLELSRRLGVRAVNEAGLIDLLGEGLYRQVDQETRRLLAEAEAAWASGEHNLDSGADYAIIGWTYRRAIENEWRLRVGDALAALDRERDPDRATLGAMLHVLRQPRPIGQQLVRRQLAGVVRGDSRIFDQIFLRRASNLIAAYLNEASHRRLDRTQCTTLRTQLLEGRVLHERIVDMNALRRRSARPWPASP